MTDDGKTETLDANDRERIRLMLAAAYAERDRFTRIRSAYGQRRGRGRW